VGFAELHVPDKHWSAPACSATGRCDAMMSTCHSAAPDARPFATAPYSLGNSERPTPWVLPARCVSACATSGDCSITRHDVRERKTGPCFPLAVLRCRTHGHAFTLYPLGHVPYGRVAIAPVSCDGEPVMSAEADGSRPRQELGWATTIFLAALDAASGRPWPRESDGIAPLWDTQLEHIGRSAKALGLCAQPPPERGEQIAVRLEVRRLDLLDAAHAYQAARGYKERGQAVVSIIERLHPGRCVLDAILACGALSGLWGQVERWDPGQGGPRCVVFPSPGTPRS
jgi:hypothetical protein